MYFNLIFLTSESIIAVCALIVSIISLLFTRQALKYQRVHNHKSVVPIGVIVIGNYISNIFVRIKNNGIGPLIIKNIIVTSPEGNANNLIDIIPQNISKHIVWAGYAKELENTTILPNEHIDLINWKALGDANTNIAKENTNAESNNIQNSLNGITVRITYSDVYGNMSEVRKLISLN